MRLIRMGRECGEEGGDGGAASKKFSHRPRCLPNAPAPPIPATPNRPGMESRALSRVQTILFYPPQERTPRTCAAFLRAKRIPRADIGEALC
jgi:hypothetical protein